MFEAAISHVVGAIEAAPVVTDPFDHVYVEEVFPPDFYRTLRAHLPPDDRLARLVDTGRVTPGYSPSRHVLMPMDDALGALDPDQADFWRALFGNVARQELAAALLTKFERALIPRFVAPDGTPAQVSVGWDVSFVRDHRDYALGPHTDAPHKLVSAIFYLPPDDAHPELGTSLYVPRRAGFECAGGPHHRFEDFERVLIQRYVPNALFAFPKTAACFHGVEPVAAGMPARDLLLYNLRDG